MAYRIRKCPCGTFTFREACPACGCKTVTAHPPKFSPEDKYGAYRRRIKFNI